MKWFEHQADAGLNKKIRKIQRRFGDNDRGGDAAMAAVGRYWRLLEVICLQGDDSFSLPAGYDLDLLADDLLATREYTEDFLNFLAEIGAIDPAAWQEGQVSCPKLGERADTYRKRKQVKDKNKTLSEDDSANRKSSSIDGEQTKPMPLEEGSDSVRTKCEPGADPVWTQCEPGSDKVAPTIPTQTQTPAPNQKAKAGAPAPPEGGSGAPPSSQREIPEAKKGMRKPRDESPVVFECPYFTITESYLGELRGVFPGLPRATLLEEFGKAHDVLTDRDRIGRFTWDRTADGKLVYQRRFFREWFKKVILPGSRDGPGSKPGKPMAAGNPYDTYQPVVVDNRGPR